ncbi:MAG TPA: hypothetical protein PKC65_10265 [Pyrinomonadaceae bacterium]|nr:hypothetical protein [Pyrinomonadaceae bacterium]
MTPLFSISMFEAAGVAAAVTFFLALCVVAYLAFRLLKKSAKMAVRLIVVLVILAVAAAGSLAIYSFLKTPAKPASKSRPTRSNQ